MLVVYQMLLISYSGMHDYDDEDDDSGNYDSHGSQSHDKNENDSPSLSSDKNPSPSSTTTASPAAEFPEDPNANPFGSTDFGDNSDFPFDPSQDYYKQLDPLEQFDFVNQPNKEIFDAEKESIIIDSAATSYNRRNKERSGKSLVLNGDIQQSSAIVSPSNPSKRNIEVHVVPDELSSDAVVESSASKNGFFYQFQHPIYTSQQAVPLQSGLVKSQPQPNQVKLILPSESLQASLFGAIPVDAVHDTQVSPKQNNVRNHQVLPLFVNVPKS